MPYILPELREKVDTDIDIISQKLEKEKWLSGLVNYVFYRILTEWWKSDKGYKTLCSIMGTLFCVAMEFYRKRGAPYESEAEARNGPIPDR